MKGLSRYHYWLALALALPGMHACDTANSVEDPDRHYYVKYYGGDGNQRGVDMEILPDGSFLLLGNYANSDFDTDVYLVRVDADGQVIWEKKFSEQDNSVAKDLEPSGDGNYMILSDYVSPDSLKHVKLIKVSPDGAALDSVTFGTEANDDSRTVTSLADGGFIVSGTTELTSTYKLASSPDPDLGDFFNYRFDSDLNRISVNEWSPVFPGFGGKLDVAVRAIEIRGITPAENKYYVFGYSNINLSNTNPNRKLGLFYFKRGPKGGESDPFFPGVPSGVDNTSDIDIHFAQETPVQLGKGFMVLGTSRNNVGDAELVFARMRHDLTFAMPVQNDFLVYSTIPLGRNKRGVAVTGSVFDEAGYLVLGDELRATGASNIWLTKIDQSGRILWSSTFGSDPEEDTAAAVRELADGRIVILGTMGLADNQSKMALIKLNAGGQLLK